MPLRSLITYLAATLLLVPTLAAKMKVMVDATDLPRKLLAAEIEIETPKDVQRNGGRVVLWYPKWVPGAHGPNGPVANLAGIEARTETGDRLKWERTPGEVYSIEVTVPAGQQIIHLETRYITNQPSTNSRGVDSFGADGIGIINLNTLLFYREDQNAAETFVDLTLRLPEDWTASTALQPRTPKPSTPTNSSRDSEVSYQTVSLVELVDAPILLGRHSRTFPLVADHAPEATPPHRLQVVSESERGLRIDEEVVSGFQRMVSEAAALFGSHPFESMDILLGSTEQLGANGLEHSTSTLNVLRIDPLTEPGELKGWNRLLIPHEYVHAWCGKYRRPAGMVTSDFHSAKDTRLLWVYEGLAQYLGTLLEVRSGLMTTEEYEWQLLRSIRSARHQQGRQWRPLVDTGSAAHTLRGRSASWSHLRRGQDYYSEGALIWMEIDARLRNLTEGQRSLDDFVVEFFRFQPGMDHPRGYDVEEIVGILTTLVTNDWATFLDERINHPRDRFQLGLLQELGYTLQVANEPPEPPEGVDGPSTRRIDALDSIGLRADDEGKILQVLLDSPADAAGLGPGMTIAGVGDFVWSRTRFLEALDNTLAEPQIELLLITGDRYEQRTLSYEEGPRHLVLERAEERPNRLAEIAAPRLDQR